MVFLAATTLRPATLPAVRDIHGIHGGFHGVPAPRPSWIGLALSLGGHAVAGAALLALASLPVPIAPGAAVEAVERIEIDMVSLPEPPPAETTPAEPLLAEPVRAEAEAVEPPAEVAAPSEAAAPPPEPDAPPDPPMEAREPLATEPPPQPSPQPLPKPQPKPRPSRSKPAAPPARSPAPTPAAPATASPPAAATPAVSPATIAPSDPRPTTDYLSRVWAMILRHKPRRALQAGRVEVTFAVTADGGLAASHVSESSGSERLDAVALEAVRRAAPFPPPPGGSGTFAVPFHFQ